jgi:hypothetical protein
MLQRNVAQIDKLHDATPGNFFDKVLFYSGQGGFPVPPTGPLTNPDAIAAFGSYWALQFQPADSNAALLGELALAYEEQALDLAKQGARTVTMTLIPERAPVPISAYDVGDFVPLFAPDALRAPIAGYQRVQTIPITITDDGIEQVQGLVVSPSWRGSIDIPPSGPPTKGKTVVIANGPAQTDARNRAVKPRTIIGGG